MSTKVESTGGEFTVVRNGSTSSPNTISGNADISNANSNQIHVWGSSNRNETISLGFDNISGRIAGHHVRGENKLYNHRDGNLSDDVFNFIDLENVGGGDVVVGRLEDFGSGNDEVQIDGHKLNLENGSSGSDDINGNKWKVVEHNGNHSGSGNAEPQKWLVIETSAGGHVVYALEGARIDESLGPDERQERHFVTSFVAQSIISQPAVNYVDPQNFVPAGTTTTSGIVYNDYDDFQADVTDVIRNGATMYTHDRNGSTNQYLNLTGDDLIAAGINNDSVEAGTGNDKVWGGSGKDTIDGGAGNDTLEGGSGNDKLIGGAGTDRLYGGSGNDRLEGGSGNDYLRDDGGSDVFNGGAGIDTASYYGHSAGMTVNLATGGNSGGDTYISIENLLGSNTANDRLTGSSGNNDLYGAGGNDTLEGGSGNDKLIGGAGTDRLYGGSGNDRLEGGSGNDYLRDDGGSDVFNGGAGIDTASYYGHSAGMTVNLATGGNSGGDTYISIENLLGSNTANDRLTGSSGNNVLYGAGGNDTLEGGSGNDKLIGGAGTDRLYGGSGNDRLEGGSGNDYLRDDGGSDVFNGGAGIDTASYYGHSAGMTVNLATGGNSGGDTYISIENLLGSNTANDRLTGSSGNNDLYGAGGNDTLEGGSGNDKLIGGAGTDRLYGGSGNDRLEGGSGNDYLRDDGGSDVFNGGAGIDTASYYGHSAGMTVNLATGGNSGGDTYISIENLLGSNTANDRLTGSSGNNDLYGAGGNDTLEGGSGNDKLIGGAGTDRLYGGSGNDRLEGGSGNDYLRDDAGSDVFNGGAGIDTASYYGQSAGMTVNLATGGNSGGDTYISIENLLGSNTANDRLTGSSGNNDLYGAGGNDTLEGGSGNDKLIGGAGNDTFVFNDGSDNDIIIDFSNNVDTIDLGGFGLTTAAQALTYASQVNGDVVFDFGDGDVLTVQGTNTSVLLDDLIF